MADPVTTAATMPPVLQNALAWGLGVGGMLAPVLAYLWPKKPPKAAADDAAAKAVTAAVIAPLGDPNQLRQIVEGINRLGDFAEQGLDRMDDIKGLLTDLKNGQRDLREAIPRQPHS